MSTAIPCCLQQTEAPNLKASGMAGQCRCYALTHRKCSRGLAAMMCRFSYDAMLDLKGNTAVYLLYAHARIASIVKKAETTKGVNVTSLIGKHPIQVGV